MKKSTLLAASLILAMLTSSAVAQTTRFNARSPSKVRIEGTSNIHNWQVEGKLIGGSMEVGPGFPIEPGQEVTAGKVEAKAQAFIPIRSLTSVKDDGTPYNAKMDDIMWEKLKTPRITYQLNELTLKEAPKTKDAPYIFDSTGELAVAGVTNKVSIPVQVIPGADGKMKVNLTTTVKMTNFGIEPPAPAIALGMIKTGDEVKLILEWNMAKAAK